MTGRRLLGALLALALLAPGLSACGKRSPLKPPAGREGDYSYPRTYPAPKSVLPGGLDSAEEGEPEPEEAPVGVRKLSPIPPSSSRTETTTYGTLPE